MLQDREDRFYYLLIIGFLIKYNFLLLHIFNVTLEIGVILKNIFLIYFLARVFLPLIKGKRVKGLLLTLYFFFTLVFMANYWYQGYFGGYLSLRDIGKGESLVTVLDMFFEQIIRPLDFLFFLDLVILHFLRYDPVVRIKSPGKTTIKLSVIALVVLLFCSQLLIANFILGGYPPMKLYQMDTGGFISVYGPEILYVFEGLLNGSSSRTKSEEVSPPEDLQETGLDNSEGSRKMNLLVVQVESLDKNIIGREVDGEEVTPFLNELREKSLYAEHFFAQHVNGSFNADFSFLTSLYLLSKNYVYSENDISNLRSLPRVLQEDGYNTMAFLNRKTFFHRDKAFPDLGFEEFYGLEDYEQQDREVRVINRGLGMNDYDLLRQSLGFVEESEEPFFAFLITSTSHGPFKYYDREQKEQFTEIDNRLVRDYFRSMSFVDRSLEMVYSRLEEMGLKDDTMLVIYGDHGSNIEESEYSARGDFGLDKSLKPPESIPLFIKHPGIEPDTLKKPGSTTDLAPTLLDLLDYKEKPEEFLGHSLLKEGKRPVLFLNEKPLVLYDNLVYKQQLEKFEVVGKYGDTELEKEDMSEGIEETILETIEYMQKTLGVKD